MAVGVLLAALALFSQPPLCAPHDLDRCARRLLFEVNAERRDAGLDALESHPVLTAVAQERAREVAANGSVEPSMARLRATTRRLYRDGYVPHDWTESALIGRWSDEIFGQWREVRPRWYEEVRAGDFEHVGIGVSRHRALPVFSLVFGLTQRTLEWRLAEPLSDLDRVRDDLLRAVNAQRLSQGRHALQPDPRLDQAAQAHARDMLERAYYEHESPDGSRVADRVRAAGYGKARRVTENIAKGLFSPDEVVARWMASSGHRRGILSTKVDRLGSGIAFGENARGFEVVWVQVFAAEPASGKPQS